MASCNKKMGFIRKVAASGINQAWLMVYTQTAGRWLIDWLAGCKVRKPPSVKILQPSQMIIISPWTRIENFWVPYLSYKVYNLLLVKRKTDVFNVK